MKVLRKIPKRKKGGILKTEGKVSTLQIKVQGKWILSPYYLKAVFVATQFVTLYHEVKGNYENMNL